MNALHSRLVPFLIFTPIVLAFTYSAITIYQQEMENKDQPVQVMEQPEHGFRYLPR